MYNHDIARLYLNTINKMTWGADLPEGPGRPLPYSKPNPYPWPLQPYSTGRYVQDGQIFQSGTPIADYEQVRVGSMVAKNELAV